MTHTASSRERSVPRSWWFPTAIVVVILVATAAGLVSRAIAIDFLAWWPVWLALGVLAFLARGKKWDRVHLSALVPLLAMGALIAFTVGYFMGWELMPSAVNRLNGPEEGPATSAGMSVRIEGEIELAPSDVGFLYTVVPLRGGGPIGIPEAVEQTQGTTVGVVVMPAADSGLYTYSGWEIGLSKVPIWSLSLSGEIDADVSGLVLSELQIDGSGLVALGPLPADATASVSGDFELEVPTDVAVTIIGRADVPGGWIETGDGWASTATGTGWIITVADGATLQVRES